MVGPTTLRSRSCTGVDKEIRKHGDKVIRKDFLSRGINKSREGGLTQGQINTSEKGVLHRGGSRKILLIKRTWRKNLVELKIICRSSTLYLSIECFLPQPTLIRDRM